MKIKLKKHNKQTKKLGDILSMALLLYIYVYLCVGKHGNLRYV